MMAETNKSYKIFKINLSFRPDIISVGIDPLMLIHKIYDIGDIVEANTNISKLPNLTEIDINKFYLSWSILLKTKFSKKDLEYIFEMIKEGNRINIEEYNESYLDYTSDSIMENRIGEVLVEKGLITEEEIKKALGAQKKLGEILIEKGLITEQEIKQALEMQKKLGEILVDEGKIMPSKLESIVEQQKQVRKFKESNSVQLDSNKLNNLIELTEELLTKHSIIMKLSSDPEKINNSELLTTVDSVNKIAQEILYKLNSLKDAKYNK